MFGSAADQPASTVEDTGIGIDPANRDHIKDHGRGKQTGNAQAVASIKLKAHGHAENLRAIISDMKAQGIVSLRMIADELNVRGILTPRGGRWHATSAARVLERLDTAN